MIPTSQIPAIAITEFLGSVNNETEMLALAGQQGDWCLRTDVAVGYVIVGTDPSVIAGWEAFTIPGSAVTSINGQVGTVVLGPADVGALPATATSDDITEGGTNLYSQWDNATGGINFAGGNVGIGTTNPAEALEVAGNAILDTSSARLNIKAGTTGNTGSLNFTFNTDSTIYGGLDLAYDNRNTDGLRLFSDSYPITIDFDAGDYFRVKDSSTEYMRIDSSGNVGIGTTEPNNLLNVYGGRIEVQTDTSLSTTNQSIFNIKTGSTGGSLFTIRAENTADNNSNWEIKTNANEQLKFTIGASESMRIDSSGRLLVGTTASIDTLISAGLQVQDTGAGAYASIGRWDNNAANPGLIFNKSRGGSVGTRGIVQSDDSLGEVTFTGDDGSNFVYGARIQAQVDGTPSANDMPGRLVFSTTADGASAPTEQMRIDSSGNVGIGTTSPDDKLEIDGNGAGIILASPNGTRYRITVADDGTLVTTAVT